jgi:MFS family permease
MDAGAILAGEKDDGSAGSIAGGAAMPRAAGSAAPERTEPKSYRELWLLTWKLIVASLILSLHNDVDFQLFPPYFYSRVACCDGDRGGPMLEDVTQYGGHDLALAITAGSCNCDLAGTYGPGAVRNGTIAACGVPFVPSESPMWSHSAHCPNFQYVQMKSQTLTSAWYSIQTLCFVVCMPFFARVSDIYGRRRSFYCTTVMSMLAFLIFTADAGLMLGDWAIYLTAPLLTVSYVHVVIAWSMAADLVPHAIDQARWFPVLVPILSGTVAATVGDLLAYFMLAAHLTDYTVVFAALACVGLGVAAFIRVAMRETMANPRAWPGARRLLCETCSQRDPDAAQNLDGLGGGGYGFGIFLRGPDGGGRWAEAERGARGRRRTLHVILAVTLGVSLASGVDTLVVSYEMGPMHFRQEELVYISLLGRLSSVACAVGAAWLIPRIGPWKAFAMVSSQARRCGGGGALEILKTRFIILPLVA